MDKRSWLRGLGVWATVSLFSLGVQSQDFPPKKTVTVVVGQFNHAACEARGTATFIVGAAVGGPTAPKSGNAGLAGSSSSALVVVLLVAVAVAVVVAARLWTPKNRG